MKTKLKPFLEGAKLSAYAYVTLGLLAVTAIQGKNTYDAFKGAFKK